MNAQELRMIHKHNRQLAKIPIDAILIGHYINERHIDKCVDELLVFDALKSHGYQTDYNHVVVKLVALRSNNTWDVREFSGMDQDKIVKGFIDSAHKFGFRCIE